MVRALQHVSMQLPSQLFFYKNLILFFSTQRPTIFVKMPQKLLLWYVYTGAQLVPKAVEDYGPYI